MSLYRKFARSKKGMSTIFGGLFFVILILMGFNVMLWGFVQLDAYNSVVSRMSQRDQQAVSENLVPVNSTCTSTCTAGSGTLTTIVNNLGGYSVTVTNMYIFNTNTTGSCQPTPCILTPIGTTGNIPAGAVNFQVQVQPNVQILKSNSYHISLATSRGRLFNLYYPWRFNSQIINNFGGGGTFQTNVGPLAIFFDFKSFNYTTGSSGACSGVAPNPSCPAFCMPAGTSVLLYLRVANLDNTYDVTLLSQTGMQAQAYGVNGFGQFAHAWIEAPNSVNPSTNFPYSLSNNYTLKHSVNGVPQPSSFAIVKIGAPGPNAAGSVSFGNANVSWITFIGIYYLYQNQAQGETIPFMDFVTSSPNCVS